MVETMNDEESWPSQSTRCTCILLAGLNSYGAERTVKLSPLRVP
jgi:hypothetical protein